jgi:hypothetical protein
MKREDTFDPSTPATNRPGDLPGSWPQEQQRSQIIENPGTTEDIERGKKEGGGAL